MGSGAGLTNSTSGDLTLRDITAGALSVTNQGPTAGTTLNLLGAINTTGASSFAADAVTINTSTGSVNAGAVTLKPFTAGRAIDLGTKTAGTLGLNDAELDRITAGLLQIGDANSGAITVSAALTQVSSLSLTTGAGMMLNQSVTMAANKNFTATTVGTISLPNATSDLATDAARGFLNLTTATNISLAGGASITTVDGNLTLSANQQATPTSGSFIGISLAGTVVQVTGGGNLTVLGKGGDGAASQYGITIAGGRVQGGTAGLVNVQGTGGPSTGFGNHGITMSCGHEHHHFQRRERASHWSGGGHRHRGHQPRSLDLGRPDERGRDRFGDGSGHRKQRERHLPGRRARQRQQQLHHLGRREHSGPRPGQAAGPEPPCSTTMG